MRLFAFVAIASAAFLVPGFAVADEPKAALPPVAPVAVEGLNSSQLSALPDATLMTIRGKSVTLGMLRQQHVERLQRFANARALNVGLLASFKKSPSRVSPGATTGPNLVHNADPKFSTYALDYQQACASVTACTYFPANTSIALQNISHYGGTGVDVDPLITEQNVCSGQGGQLASDGCAYTYPMGSIQQFVTGSPPSYTSQISCGSAIFAASIDPHGAVTIANSLSGASAVKSDAAQFCAVKILAPPQ